MKFKYMNKVKIKRGFYENLEGYLINQINKVTYEIELVKRPDRIIQEHKDNIKKVI